ncbi:MAG TPA: DUF3619 family protein [Thiolapillus brandeum]|uniref:DUF3619 family protein n=1 Tax=Thiolapillus brandeum TaxID=1076588 RepID=A0A831RTL3_9GAMM|nr:DUF3619 family protein [Thiolapillus brandeum]
MQSFEENLKKSLDNKAASLDAATLSRLHRARVKALETSPPWWKQPAVYAPVLGSAAAVAAYLLLSTYYLDSNLIQTTVSSDPVEAMEIISLDVDLELVEELDFYDWLAQQEDQEKDA